MWPKANFDKISKFHSLKFWEIKWYHVKVRAESFHLNGHTIGFCPQNQKLELPYKTLSNTLAVKGLTLWATATPLQRPLYFVPVDSPYIYSYLKLSLTATSLQWQQPLKRVPNCQNNFSTMTSFFSVAIVERWLLVEMRLYLIVKRRDQLSHYM